MKLRASRYYQKKFPMNTFQKSAHDIACRKVIEHYKDSPMRVNKGIIELILKCWYMYNAYCAKYLHKWKAKEDPSLIYIGPFGYIRKIFPALFTEMKDNGEFTDQEWDVIRNEFYKEEIDVYETLMQNRKTWVQKQKKLK